jgi:hypothetical protein
MIGSIHHKLHAFGNSTEFPDYQLVTDEVVEVCDVLLKLVGTIWIIVIGIVADDDTRVLYNVLDKTESWQVRIWKNLVGVGSIHYHHTFFVILAK